MIDFFKKLFGQSGSSATAKERLRLVLMTDHIALAPEMIDQMKRDLVDVISRYVQVDREKVEVNFEREDRALAMLANIPIVSVNRPTGGDAEKTEAAKAPAATAVEQTAEAEPVATAPASSVALAPADSATLLPAIAAAPNVASPGAQAATNAAAAPPRRRRRKKSGGSQKPATAH